MSATWFDLFGILLNRLGQVITSIICSPKTWSTFCLMDWLCSLS